MTIDMMPGVDAPFYAQELKRSLGLGDLLIYGLVFIGIISPIPVFGIVFSASKGMVPLTYLVGLVAMVFTAFSYMTMARVYPVSGSVYAYAARTMGGTVGFLSGWAILLDYLLLPALCNVVCALAVHAIYPAIPQWACIVVLLVCCTWINYLGIESTARVNLALLGLQFVILMLFLGVTAHAVWRGLGGAHLSMTPFFDAAAISPGVLLRAASLGVLSFLGFDAISTLSEEAKGGSGAIARATILSLLIAAVIFIALTYLPSLFLGGRTGFANDAAADVAFYDVAARVGGPVLRWLVALPGVVIGTTAGSLAAQAATARLIYSMARDGTLPRVLAKVDAVRQVPARAVLLVAAVNLVLSLTLVSSLELLTSMVCFGALLGFVMVNLAVLVQFRRAPERSWFAHVVSPTLGAVITGFVLVNSDGHAKIAGAGWLALGGAYHIVKHRLARSTAPTADAAGAPPGL